MKNIRKKIGFGITFILLLGTTITIGLIALPEASHTEDAPLEIELVAGGGNPKSAIIVGKVKVWNDNDYLYIKYETDEFWIILETHLHVADSLSGIPQTKKCNPIPGHFEYNSTELFEEGVQEKLFPISLPEEWKNNGDLFIAAHAVVAEICIPMEVCDHSEEETAWGAGFRFNDKNWATYFEYKLQFTVTFPEEGNAYIGYEDLTGGDFDYNDFGMNMYVQEIYVSNDLSEITLEFESVEHSAGLSHDIHITRTMSDNTEYTYSITRTTIAQGTETPATLEAFGSGDFDIVLFDSDFYTYEDKVTIHIIITNCDDFYNPSPTPPRWDLAPVFEYYDPWMYVRIDGPAIHIGDWQPATPPLPSDGGYNVPYIIVIPYTDWPAPSEGETILVYPDFDDYYRTQDPIYTDWYIP